MDTVGAKKLVDMQPYSEEDGPYAIDVIEIPKEIQLDVDKLSLKVIAENRLSPGKTPLFELIRTWRQWPFFMHFVLQLVMAYFAVLATMLIAKHLGLSGLLMIQNIWFCVPSLIILLVLSLISGNFIYFQGPFLPLAAIVSGMAFTFWLACLVSVGITGTGLGVFYLLAKRRYKPKFLADFCDGDHAASCLARYCTIEPTRWINLTVGILSLFPDQIIVLVAAVAGLRKREVVLYVALASVNSISYASIGYSISYAVLANSSYFMIFGCLILYGQSFLEFLFLLFTPNYNTPESPFIPGDDEPLSTKSREIVYLALSTN